MIAEDNEIQLDSEEVMGLVEPVNQKLPSGTVPVDLSGIIPHEGETDTTTVTEPHPADEDGFEEMTVVTLICRMRTIKDNMVGIS